MPRGRPTRVIAKGRGASARGREALSLALSRRERKEGALTLTLSPAGERGTSLGAKASASRARVRTRQISEKRSDQVRIGVFSKARRTVCSPGGTWRETRPWGSLGPESTGLPSSWGGRLGK